MFLSIVSRTGENVTNALWTRSLRVMVMRRAWQLETAVDQYVYEPGSERVIGVYKIVIMTDHPDLAQAPIVKVGGNFKKSSKEDYSDYLTSVDLKDIPAIINGDYFQVVFGNIIIDKYNN